MPCTPLKATKMAKSAVQACMFVVLLIAFGLPQKVSYTRK